MLAELVAQVLGELGRVVVAELGADLEDYDLRLGLLKEFFDVGDDDVDGVGKEDAVADAAVLLYADVDAAGAGGELAVDGEGLALGEGAADEGDSDFVGGRVVGPRPHDLVDAELLRVEGGHPVFPVGGAVVAAGEIAAAALLDVGEGFLLGLDVLPPLHLLRELGSHGCLSSKRFIGKVLVSFDRLVIDYLSPLIMNLMNLGK